MEMIPDFHFKKKHGDNLEGSGALKLTGGGDLNPNHPITNLINYDQVSYYFNWSNRKPSGESDSWIELDFVNEKINLTSYPIKTYIMIFKSISYFSSLFQKRYKKNFCKCTNF